jgi:hypothetical protein
MGLRLWTAVTTDLLFIPQVIYEHGEPRWNDVNRRKLLTRPTDIFGNPTSSHLVASRRNGRRNDEFGLAKHFCSYLQVTFLHVVKSYDLGLTALLPFRRKVWCGFLSPLKSIASAGFEPVNRGSNCKHANHYTTEVNIGVGYCFIGRRFTWVIRCTDDSV